jgi:hypothetical protein
MLGPALAPSRKRSQPEKIGQFQIGNIAVLIA